MRIRNFTLTWLKIIYKAVRCFYFDNYTYIASSLAFVTILSLVPVLSLIIYFFSYYLATSSIINAINNYIYSNFLPTSVETVKQYLDQFISHAIKLPVFSLIFSIITGILLIFTLEHALNQIWHTNLDKKNLAQRLASWIILFFLPLFIGISSLLSEYVYYLARYDAVKFWLAILINLLINGFIFAILFSILPRKNIIFKDAYIAGLITAILYEIAKKLFVFYIEYFTNYIYLYGALATIPIFLVWVYFSWSIFLFGGLLLHAKMESDAQKSLTHKN